MQMLRATCAECSWTFDVEALFLPMRIDIVPHVMFGLSCPMCGNNKDHMMAEPRALTSDEAKHKLGIIVKLNPSPLRGT